MNEFSFEWVKYFLSEAKKITKILPFDRYTDDDKKCILLRQDMDLDALQSLVFAQIEKELDIRSTFFFRVRSPTYNILSKEISEIIQWMSGNNFEIGLHFDASLYQKDENIEHYVIEEADVLSNVCGYPIRTVSYHNPTIYDKYPQLKNFVTTYDKRFFSDAQYLSDSLREIPYTDAFRGKKPVEFISKAQFPLQICLHPEQYFTHDGGTYVDTISRYLSNTLTSILKQHEKSIIYFLQRKKQ